MKTIFWFAGALLLFSCKQKVETTKPVIQNITESVYASGKVKTSNQYQAFSAVAGIEVLVDGAHSFAHLDFKVPDLGGDYFASSLHKWLYAPIGSGMLYVRKEKIKNIYPLFASDEPLKEDIRKFEHLGTRPFFIEQAIGKAIEFHEMIGAERKQKRLHYLKNYWMEKVKNVPSVKLHTSLHPKWSGAIGLVSVEGKTLAELDAYLFGNYRIHTASISWENINGIRVTPNVYTTTSQLDELVKGITNFALL